jgi:arabinose operon protein AraL
MDCLSLKHLQRDNSRSKALTNPTRLYDAYIFDLDGTVYLGDRLLPTAFDTISRIRGLGKRTVFLSNNPTHFRAEQAAKLTALGLPTPADDVINSSVVMVNFLQRHLPGAKLFVIGETPLETELRRAGFELTRDAQQVDAVIASFDRTFVYEKLQIAFDAIRAGARFLCYQWRPLLPGARRWAAGRRLNYRRRGGLHQHHN